MADFLLLPFFQHGLLCEKKSYPQAVDKPVDNSHCSFVETFTLFRNPIIADK